MDARAGMGVTIERQPLVIPPEPPVPELLISPEAALVRRLPIGAEPQLGGGVHFSVWAPRCCEVAVEIEGLEPAALQPETDGYFSLWSVPALAGMRYRFRLDRGEKALPDPASRFQPEGPHGPPKSSILGSLLGPTVRGAGARASNSLSTSCSDMARLGFVVSQIREIEDAPQKRLEQHETGPHAMVWLLARIVGVGVETADMLVHEVLSRPRDRRAVARYASLTSAPARTRARQSR